MDLHHPRQFEVAYNAHWRRVVGAARRVLGDAAAAEDVAHEVFLRVWQRPDLYDDRRGSLGTFLAVMARSRALDRVRSDGALERARDRLAAVESLQPATVESPAAAVERSEERERLRRALLLLPPAQRETIALAYGREMTSAEIAREMHVARATARSRLRLGIAKLRTELGDELRAA